MLKISYQERVNLMGAYQLLICGEDFNVNVLNKKPQGLSESNK
jgi:hypothetical protein